MPFSFEANATLKPVELADTNMVNIGAGRPADPHVSEFGAAVKEVWESLSPGSQWVNSHGKPLGLPIPNEITNKPVNHRDGSQSIDKKVNCANFAQRVKLYAQRGIAERDRENLAISVRPHMTTEGPIYVLGVIRRMATPLNGTH